MENRSLTEEEISILEDNGCSAEDWSSIYVAEDFTPSFVHHTAFYGEVYMGVFDKNIEIEEGFIKHSGIRNATLRNVSVGDNALIENIGNYISGYAIGENCYISNVGTMSTTPGATFGEGNMIAVLNEGGQENVMLYDGLSSQMAALMVRHSSDKEAMASLRKLILRSVHENESAQGLIGERVKIVSTDEIINTNVGDDCEISGASRLNESTLMSIPEASIWVGTDVICENTIVSAGSSVLDGAKLDNCFVGEACHIGKGFSASNSLFFANSYMDNGEACASFCGPFSVSHHKSTLLIGGMYSFYNAGSATNFSNHAYKLGPIHYGEMERGCKTASGAHLLWPAAIGAFSMCMGKIQNHPDTHQLPFSYLIASGDTTYIAPGYNLATVGTFRDITKWPRRDKRPRRGRQSLVHFEWLNPYTVAEIISGKQILEDLRREQGETVASYNYNGCLIKNKALMRGLDLYDMAIRIYMGETVKNHKADLPKSSVGTGNWSDLAGLLLPESEEQQLLNDVATGYVDDIKDVEDRFSSLFEHYPDYKWTWTYRIILSYFRLDTLEEEDVSHIIAEYEKAKKDWISAIRYDAEKEFQLGDVDENTLKSFLDSLNNIE
jgi:hypothetical protein